MFRRFQLRMCLSGLLLAYPSLGWTDCPGDAAVAALAADIQAGAPADLTALSVVSPADGRCAQEKLVAALGADWGDPIGYKAGLTSAAAQARFGVKEPVSGRLYENGLLEDGERLPADWGALPRWEADLLVEVADAGINSATTEAEVLDHLAAIYPFVELPDLVVADPTQLDGPLILAINVGARYGVVGEAIMLDEDVEDRAALLRALAEMQVVAQDEERTELLSAPGSAILGHPLRAVLWLIRDGAEFEAGDLISLGSLGPLMRPEPNMTVTVHYRGLPGNPSVSVGFD
jgi:2-oxo-hept-3-ene-1,7-dioate hydratase